MQLDIARIHEIAAELERKGRASGASQVATISTSLILSMIPVIGGPASYLVDKLGTNLSEADHTAIGLELSRAILAIAPQIERIGAFEESVAAIAEVLRTHTEILDRARQLIEAGATSMDTHEINNNGGLKEVVNTTFRNIRLVSVTKNGGVSTFDGIDHEGPSRFDVEPGSKSTTSNSTFTGRGAGVSTSVVYGAPATNYGATVEHNVREPGRAIGLSVSTILGPDESGAALSIGPNGVEFGRRTRS